MRFLVRFVSMMALGAGLGAGNAMALPVNSSGDVTPDVIFGTGNGNGSFTGVTVNNIELALRGKIRYQGVYNYDGDHTYTYDPLTYPSTSTRSAYNFEWSINTNADGSGSNTIGSFDYLLQIDTNPSVATSFISLDPYALSYADHSFGNNSTVNGGGLEAADAAEFSLFKSLYNVSQQSWNMGFGFLPNPDQEGFYTFVLSVLEKGTTNTIASTTIDIQYGSVAPVPLPAALPLMLSALCGLGGLSMLKQRRCAAT